MSNHDSIGPLRSSTPRRRLPVLRAAALAGLLLASRSVAAGPNFVVNSLADVPARPNTTDCVCETSTGNGVCTLRAAIMEANASQDAIARAPAGVYALTRIASPVGVHPENGDLDVLARMRIEGDGPSATIVDGSGLMRVFRVGLPQITDLVELRDLTIRNGNEASGGYGGGIEIASRTLLEIVHLEGNRGNFGGAIATTQTQRSTLMLRHCVVSTNTSANGAGGIHRPPLLLGTNPLRNGGATGEELGLASTFAEPASVELNQPPYWSGAGGRGPVAIRSPSAPTGGSKRIDTGDGGNPCWIVGSKVQPAG